MIHKFTYRPLSGFFFPKTKMILVIYEADRYLLQHCHTVSYY
jgi:hypothetical protein